MVTDVYIYLSNDVPDQTRRKSLMSQCMRILEKDFKRTEDLIDSPDGQSEPAQYLGPDQPYLDMTKSSFVTSTPKSPKSINFNEQSQSVEETDPNEYVLREYVDVTTPGTVVVEEDNVNYVNVTDETHKEKSTSLGNSTHYDQLQFQDWTGNTNSTPVSPSDQSKLEDECPFGGLPAAHLTLRQATHTGWLIRPRRYLTDKRYYAGVLDGWLLLYSSGEASIRPSSCYALRRCSWIECQDVNDKHRLTLIADSSTKKKKRHFHMNCQKELKEWVTAFSEAKPSACLNLFGARKLPTPPPPSQLESNTGPCPSMDSISGSSTASTISLEVDPNKSIEQTTPSPKIYVNQRHKVEEIYEEPVELMASLNKLKRQQIATPTPLVVSQEYDIPKPKPRPVNPPPETLPVEVESTPAIAEPPKSTSDSFEEIKSKVEAQLLVNSPKSSPIRTKSEPPKDDQTPSRRRRSDMRSWLYRLSRRGRRSLIHVVTKSTSRNTVNPKKDDHRIGEEATAGTGEGATSDTGSSRKGGKVNQIINQLEANGHRAPMFRVAINRSKVSKWGGGGNKKVSSINGGDEHNYEPVTVVTTA